jgi:hypothetical protein
MRRVINLLPIAIEIPGLPAIEAGEYTITTSPHEGRYFKTDRKVGCYPLFERQIGGAKIVEINGLPFPSETPGVYYVVDVQTAEALAGRGDLLLLVEENGVPLGFFSTAPVRLPRNPDTDGFLYYEEGLRVQS